MYFLCTHALYTRNICRKLNDFSRHRHSEDAVSVQRIVEELELECPRSVQDLFHDRMRKEVMMTSQDASKKLDGNERHSRGEAILDSSAKVSIYHYSP